MNNNKEVIELLNKQVAEWTVLFTKLHNYHWYVKGPNFFSLHEKFEELYNEASVYIDDIAERILAIDGNPIATLQEALEWSEVIGQLEEGIQLAEKLDDEMTGDMLLGMVTSLEKHNWMLKSFLG